MCDSKNYFWFFNSNSHSDPFLSYDRGMWDKNEEKKEKENL